MVLCLILSTPVLAEAPAQQPAANYGAPAPQPQPQSSSRSVQVFDDRVFDLTPREAAAPTLSREGRVLDAEPTYNTEQRQRWLDSCAPIRDKDAQAYRDCYANEKAKDARAQRDSFEQVERRQALPGQGGPLFEETRRNSNVGIE
jgi:hypothetical protein